MKLKEYWDSLKKDLEVFQKPKPSSLDDQAAFEVAYKTVKLLLALEDWLDDHESSKLLLMLPMGFDRYYLPKIDCALKAKELKQKSFGQSKNVPEIKGTLSFEFAKLYLKHLERFARVEIDFFEEVTLNLSGEPVQDKKKETAAQALALKEKMQSFLVQNPNLAKSSSDVNSSRLFVAAAQLQPETPLVSTSGQIYSV